MEEADQLTIQIDGVEVTGVLGRRSHRFVEVELTAPFAGLRSSCTVPLMACSTFDFRGTEGDRTARSLLRTLYGQAQFMVAEKTALKEQWRQTKQAIAELRTSDPGADDEELRAARSRLRQRFRAGLIDQHEYQAEVRRLHQLRMAYEGRRRVLIDGFMTQWTWGLDLAQVLRFIGEHQ